MARATMALIDFIKYQKYILITLGLWPLKNLRWALIYNLNALLTSFGVSYCFLTSLTIDMFINGDNKEALADASYYFLTQLTFVIKFTIFVIRRQKFMKILGIMESPIFNHGLDYEDFVIKWWRFADVFIKCYLVVCYTAWIFYTIFPLIDRDPNNILPFKGWFPFDVKNDLLNRRLVYGFQVFGLGSAIAINVSLDSVLTGLLNIGSAQIEILKCKLKNATNFDDKYFPKIIINSGIQKMNFADLIPEKLDDLVRKRIEDCVEHHLAIIRFLKDVDSVFGLGMFIQFVSSGIIICITGLQLILIPPSSIKFFTIISYFVAMIVQISAYCWNGNDIIIQSSSIGDSCYEMDWYRTGPKTRACLRIIMERSKVAMKVSAGKFFFLSIPTLTTILRSAYSYFAVLRRVYKDK